MIMRSITKGFLMNYFLNVLIVRKAFALLGLVEVRNGSASLIK